MPFKFGVKLQVFLNSQGGQIEGERRVRTALNSEGRTV